MVCEKKHWHKSVFGDNVLYVQAKTVTCEEDRETDNQGQESSGDETYMMYKTYKVMRLAVI